MAKSGPESDSQGFTVPPQLYLDPMPGLVFRLRHGPLPLHWSPPTSVHRSRWFSLPRTQRVYFSFMTVKPGSKYYPLFEHLQKCDEEKTTLTFTKIESLLGNTLPASALKRKNWWSNRDSNSALQALAWVSAGYHIEAVDLTQKTVTFRKFKADYNIQKKEGAIVWQQDAIKALRKHMSLTQEKFAQELGVRRQTVSEWENGVYDPDRSTTKFLELIAKQCNFPQIESDQ